MPQRSPKTGRRRRSSSRSNHGDTRPKRRRVAATPPPSRGLNPLVWLATAGLIAAGIFLAVRHNQSAGTGGANSNATADVLFRETLAAYKNLNNYSDVTRIQLHAPVAGGFIDESAIVRTSFMRPNLVHLSAERPGTGVVIEVASDGDSMRARVQDPGTGNFDRQLVEIPAPTRISVGSLFAATEYADVGRPGELNSMLMSLPAPLQISQLSPLLDEQPFGELLKSATKKERLEDKRLNGKECYRVALALPAGQFTFWIDSESRLLQRIEFPTPGGADTGGQLICDYTSISTEPPLRNQFSFPTREGAQLVRNFVLPTNDLAPKGLNEPAGDFAFTNLADESVSSSTFADKITVLCWYDARPANEIALSKLQAVYDATVTDDKYEFLLIATDPTTAASHADVEQRLKSWNITMPVVRDLAAVGRDRFDIQATPTLIVLDDKGTVQLNETGIDPQLDEQLPGVLKLIAEGKPIAADYVQFLQQRRQAYERQLAAASLNAPQVSAANVPTDIPPATKPERLKLTKLWAQNELTEPGNIYARRLPDDRVSILVHDGWQHVVELDSGGEIRKRHKVADSEATAIQRLRSFTNARGEPFRLGWSTLTQQVAVWNDNWETVCVYPPQPSANAARIQTAELTDLDEDGKTELYVGFAPSNEAAYRGLHAVGMDGELLWKNEDAESVRSITQSVDESGTRFLLTTNQTGMITPIAADGTAQKPLNVGKRAVHQLFASDATDPDSVFCGFTFFPNGEKLAIAIDGDLTDKWEFGLPPGVFRNQIEFLTTADWYDNSPWWTIAGPDGSVSFVSHDGEFHDHFQSGQELTGIATYKTGGANVLLLSSKNGVTAWTVEFVKEQP